MADDALKFTMTAQHIGANGRVELALKGTGTATNTADETHVIPMVVGPSVWRCVQKSTYVSTGTVTERFGRAANFTDTTDDELSVFGVSTAAVDRVADVWSIELEDGETLYYKPTPSAASATVTLRLHLVQLGGE